ncbi:MAG: DUF4476 domain-containing protein [Chitinophagaceae bacterium]
MKKLLLLLAIFILSIPAFAGWGRSYLMIREERGQSISVVIDGRHFPKTGKILTIGDLPTGTHTIKVYRNAKTRHYGYKDYGDPRMQGTLIYRGRIFLKSGRIYYATVSRGYIDLEEDFLDDRGRRNNQSTYNNWDAWDNVHNQWKRPNSWKNKYQEEEVDDRDYNNFNQDYNHDNDWGHYQNGMSQSRFNQLIQEVKNASFEKSKVSIAETALSSNSISVSQLLGILNEFSFESSKLEFAKKAYNSVSDKQNLFQVNSAFMFDSSKEDWNKFLRSQDR